MSDNVTICVFARAPVPGTCKTRLAQRVGDFRAARIQAQLTHIALRTAVESGAGPVALWCAPDSSHRFFGRCRYQYGVRLQSQCGGDLGQRMHYCLRQHRRAVIIGTDCPVLAAEHIRRAAEALQQEAQAVFIPAEDGGYVLVGTNSPDSRLFRGIHWGGPKVMADTRIRLQRLGIHHLEGPMLWDVDTPADLARARAAGFNLD